MNCNEPIKKENARGIDVSRWQGDIDWSRVASAGITHAIAKMTEGGDYTDPKFVTNFQGMQANGLKAGVYHYFRALSSTPCEQLNNIKGRLAEVAFKAGRDRLVIDVETNRNEGASPDQMADALFQLVTLVRVSLLEGHTRIFTPLPASGVTAWPGASTTSVSARCGLPIGKWLSPQCLKPGAAKVKAGSGGSTAARAGLTVFRGR